MTPESTLAAALSSSSSQEDLTALPIEALVAIVKEAGHYKDLKPGFFSKAKRYLDAPPSRGNILGGAALLGGAQLLDESGKESKKHKKASAVLATDAWARELARQDMDKLASGELSKEKTAFLGKVLGLAAQGLNKAGPALRPAIARIGRATAGQRAGYGAAGGAALNVARHFMKPKEERGSLLGAAAKGALVGGGAGLAAKPVIGKMVQSPTYKAIAKGKFQFPRASPAAAAGPEAAK